MIKVIDDVCGSGKTTWAIQMMKNNPNGQYMFVTPFLTEAKRIREALPDCEFFEPEGKLGSGKKLDSLKNFIVHSVNIVTTHALFHTMDSEAFEFLQNQSYTLIIDEVLDVSKDWKAAQSDIEEILEKYAHIESDGKLVWDDENYAANGDHAIWKERANSQSLYVYTSSKLKKSFFIDNFPNIVFTSLFQDIYILTYLFDCQPMSYYLQYHHIPYDKYALDNGNLIPYQFHKLNTSLIHIWEDTPKTKYNAIGKNETSLSKNWLCRRYDNMFDKFSNAKMLQVQISNIIKNVFKCRSNDILWTTYSDCKSYVKGKGYTKGYRPCNDRSTNAFQDRHYILYGCNMYLSPIIKQFYYDHGVKVEEDKWALSMLLQFICRSAIRKGEDIYLYIPSIRMRKLLNDYINS